MMMQLVTALKLPAATVSAFAAGLLDHHGREAFGGLSTVRLLPAGSTKTGEAVVLISRKRARGVVSAAEARQMALRFLEAAEATESDQLLSEALRATGIGKEQQERVFGYLRELRRLGWAYAQLAAGRPSTGMPAGQIPVQGPLGLGYRDREPG
jgi:hypothetical protein